MNFSEKLAAKRKANNLSQEQLADAVGVTRQSVSKWESGESYPDMAKIIQLCKILNCSLNDIMDDGVMGEIVEDKKENKKNYLKDFLDFVTNTYNMFIAMSFKSKIKMFAELIFIVLILLVVGSIAYLGLELIIRSIFDIIPGMFGYTVRTTLESISICLLLVLGVIIFFHLFKIRYLDYYITIEDRNANEQSIEEPIEENSISNEFSNKKKEIIVIRDPKHSSSKFIEGLVKVLKFITKSFIAIMTLPFVACFVMATVGIVFLILQKGMVFKYCVLICLGVLILMAAILYLFYMFFFNQKVMHHFVLIGIISGLLVCGISTGLLANSIYNMEKVDTTDIYANFREEVVELKFTENDILFVGLCEVEFETDEAVDGLRLEIKLPENSRINLNESYGGGYTYFDVYAYVDDFAVMKLFMNDLANGQLRDYYGGSIVKMTVKGKSELINKLSLNNNCEIRAD
ncbi:MAG: helix-turn-helix transcriptional regulator [Erysipelotrichaceae bacterium]|nr:helix-turn-helix transcriptional regulator [Erysipelotrichaceae bacterium]